jgi:hypothetical protein
MKNAWIVGFALLLVAVAGFAQTPSPPPLTSQALAVILGESAGAGSCAAQQNGVLFAAKPPVKALCTATASCVSGTVYCEGNNSTASCTAVDRNCASGERGHVTCDGATTWCPTACGCSNQYCCECQASEDCYSCCRCQGYGDIICSRMC